MQCKIMPEKAMPMLDSALIIDGDKYLVVFHMTAGRNLSAAGSTYDKAH